MNAVPKIAKINNNKLYNNSKGRFTVSTTSSVLSTLMIVLVITIINNENNSRTTFNIVT